VTSGARARALPLCLALRFRFGRQPSTLARVGHALRLLVILLACGLVSTSCHRDQDDDLPEGERPGPLLRRTDPGSLAMMPEFQAMRSGIRLADSVQLYEGLPHPLFHHEEFEKERTSKPVVEHHGWWFYTQPLALAGTDLAQLRAACSDAGNFRITNSIKFCGGFHPDYELSWKQGDRSFDVQFCFGCYEAKMYLGGTLAIYADIPPRVFLPLLEHYREQRPEHAPFAR
jgi:hypothetical protein